MSLDKFVIKYLTLKRLILLIVIAIYTCNYERTSKPALFFKKDIDYGGDNLAIDPSMIKHYNLQKESIELRKINNELVRQIKTRQKVLLTLSTTTNVSSLLPNSKKITVKESEIDKNIIKDNIFDAMNKATNNMQNRNSNLLKVYFGGKSFSWNEARGKFSGNFGILNKKNRRPSYPFLSGDGFRAICKHRCEDKGCSFNPRDVANGDCVYLASTDLKSFKTTVKYIESFFRTMFPKIDKNIIIIVHNGDLSTPEGDNWHKNERGGESVSRNVWEKSFTIYLDNPKILAYATNNCNFNLSVKKHSKIICLPIGIENRYNRYGNPNEYEILIENNAKNTVVKHEKKLIELSFGLSKIKPFRKEALDSVKKLISIDKISNNKMPHRKWLQHISHSVKFVVSPHGHGLDCHRTWEALYSGAFIIVKRSTLDEMYSSLPAIILKHWDELDEEELNRKYKKFNKQPSMFNYDKLFFPFWVDKLIKVGLKFN